MVTETDRRALDPRYGAASRAEAGVIDVGLRQYMLRVYNYMGSGLLLSGIVALLVSSTGLQSLFFQNVDGRLGYTGLGLLGVFTPLGLILAMSFGAHRMKASTLKVLYWAFVGTMGIGLSAVMLRYTGVSVTRVFFITAISFGGLSLFGYVTKRDMSGLGTFFLMGLIGLLVAGIAQIFIQSAALQFVYSVVGVLLFAGLTAYDTQRIKNGYFQVQGTDAEHHSAIMGAISIYLDFVNLFQFLLMFLGVRRD